MAGLFDVNDILEKAYKLKASDLHLKVGSPPMIRIDGSLRPLEDYPKLSTVDTEEIIDFMVSDRNKRLLSQEGSVDFAYSLPGVSRFRVNAFHQRGSLTLAIRTVTVEIPSFDELTLPAVLKEIAHEQRGLVLVTGITGSGKSTTLAALIDYINEYRPCNIITIEDPIEFLHTDKNSIISQREIGIDAVDFESALKYVMRQDPDVILVGEMRDLETMRVAVTAAETGHLVFSTMHTTDAKQTVERILHYYPTEASDQIRMQLSLNLKAVVSQRLLVKVGGGRIPAVEILRGTPIVQKLLLKGQTHELGQAIQNQEAGMQTFNQSLVDLYKDGLISYDDGMAAADDPGAFRRNIKGGYSDGDRKSIIG